MQFRRLTKPLPEPYRYADGVAEKIVQNLSLVRWGTTDKPSRQTQGRYVEPVHLQLVANSLWEQMLEQEATVISSTLQGEHGKIDGVLSRYYEESLKLVSAHRKARERRMRDWFDQQLITPADTRGLVFRQENSTGGMPNDAVDALVDRHIVRGEERAGGRWYELSHDRWIAPIKKANQRWKRTRARHQLFWVLSGLTVLLAAGVTLGYQSLNLNPSIVPPPLSSKVREVFKLEPIDYGRFYVKRDIRVIDLRSRKKLRFWQTKHGGRFSPVTWLRYTLAKKRENNLDAQTIRFRFATTGYAVFPRCLTHDYELRVNRVDPKLHPGRKLREEWNVVVNVGKERDNDFLVATEATFWNAFQGSTEWASIAPADTDTRDIGISLIFPQDNTYSSVTLHKHHIGENKKTRIGAAVRADDRNVNAVPKGKIFSGTRERGANGENYEVFLDPMKRTVFWLINKPSIEYRYDIEWTWDRSSDSTRDDPR